VASDAGTGGAATLSFFTVLVMDSTQYAVCVLALDAHNWKVIAKTTPMKILFAAIEFIETKRRRFVFMDRVLLMSFNIMLCFSRIV